MLTVRDNVGVLFSGSGAHFQIWKCPLICMKNGNKIAEKSEKKIGGWWVMFAGFRVQV